jgi:hypothetical protein
VSSRIVVDDLLRRRADGADRSWIYRIYRSDRCGKHRDGADGCNWAHGDPGRRNEHRCYRRDRTDGCDGAYRNPRGGGEHRRNGAYGPSRRPYRSYWPYGANRRDRIYRCP